MQPGRSPLPPQGDQPTFSLVLKQAGVAVRPCTESAQKPAATIQAGPHHTTPLLAPGCIFNKRVPTGISQGLLLSKFLPFPNSEPCFVPTHLTIPIEQVASSKYHMQFRKTASAVCSTYP